MGFGTRPTTAFISSGSSEEFALTSSDFSSLNTSYPAADYTDKVALVLSSEGLFLNRKRKGLYRSDGASWVWMSDYQLFFKDSESVFYDDVDNTKKARLELSSISSGNQRVFTLPDKDGTLAMLADISSATVLPAATSFPSGAFEGQTLWRTDVNAGYSCFDATGDTTLSIKWRRIDKIEVENIISPVGESWKFIKSNGSGGCEFSNNIDGGTF